MVDRTGKELQVGQVVELHLSGMYQAKIIDIRDKPLAVTAGKMAPPQVALQILLQHVPSDGVHAGLYVISDAEPQISLGSV